MFHFKFIRDTDLWGIIKTSSDEYNIIIPDLKWNCVNLQQKALLVLKNLSSVWQKTLKGKVSHIQSW